MRRCTHSETFTSSNLIAVAVFIYYSFSIKPGTPCVLGGLVKRLNQIPAQVIPKVAWHEMLQYSFRSDFPSIDVVPKAEYVTIGGEEAERSLVVTQRKFLGRSGPARNSTISQQLLVSLP